MKILVIGHTCFSTYNNMGKTFLSLFSAFRREELCQLYIYPSLPDVDVCGSYYRVTDKDVLKSLYSFRQPGGKLDISRLEFGTQVQMENPSDSAIYRNKRNAAPLIRLARDAMWKVSRWYTPPMRRWVEEQKPDCIFLAPGYAAFIYDIALHISRDYHLPIVVYLCDDYYFVQEQANLIGGLQLSQLRRKTDQLMRRAKQLVTICEEMKDAYGTHFHLPGEVIMTGSDLSRLKNTTQAGEKKVIAYFGNLARNRTDSIVEIGRLLDRINIESDYECTMALYTPALDDEAKEKLKAIRSVRLMGFVSGAEFVQAMAYADVLLHTEAFDEENRDLVKYSVSTKIADSLASGIPLLAYGPENVASMAHLIRNDCAITATSKDALCEALKTALFDEDRRQAVVKNALAVAQKYHQKEVNSAKLREILERVVENWVNE